jgi:hypothetical protein
VNVRFSAHQPNRGSFRILSGHGSLIVFRCHNLCVQIGLQPVCFKVTGLEKHGGMVVAALVLIAYGKERRTAGRERSSPNSPSPSWLLDCRPNQRGFRLKGGHTR